MSDLKTVGIIGQGEFGSLLKRLVPIELSLTTHDRKDTKGASLEETLKADVVFVAVPLPSYEELLPRIAATVSPDTLLVDVCSVKVEAAELWQQLLPHHKSLMLTHPLFGPQTADDLSTKSLIVTKRDGDKAEAVLSFARDELGLNIVEVSNEEHDEQMAWVHALTFYVGRGLLELGARSEPFMTPSYQHIMNLLELESHHSKELFLTIQRGNPYAESVRGTFLAKLENLETEIMSPAIDATDVGGLAPLRQELDTLNAEIIKLLARRFEVTQKVGEYKRDNSLPAVDPERETIMFEGLVEQARSEGLNPVFARSLFRLVVDEVVKNHKSLQSQ